MRRVLFALLSLFAFVSIAYAQDSLAPSTWKNQRGSILYIAAQNPFNNKFVGTYTNKAPGFTHCAGTPYPLWGAGSGNDITFTVVWSAPFHEDCKSTTVWTGKISGRKIATRWVLTTASGQTLKGRDFFVRQ
jgi:hypothetical protein